MIIRKMAISRRAVLRGMGVAVALPFLDAMVQEGLVATSTVEAVRYTRAAPAPDVKP